MNELLTCVKLIKMYAWEKPFSRTIEGRRLGRHPSPRYTVALRKNCTLCPVPLEIPHSHRWLFIRWIAIQLIISWIDGKSLAALHRVCSYFVPPLCPLRNEQGYHCYQCQLTNRHQKEGKDFAGEIGLPAEPQFRSDSVHPRHCHHRNISGSRRIRLPALNSWGIYTFPQNSIRLLIYQKNYPNYDISTYYWRFTVTEVQ